MDRNNNPIWELYNSYRTTKLNVKYYSNRISVYENLNIAFEIVIAITAPGGAISALWFWDTNWGTILWKLLLAIASIASLIKPFLNLTNKIKITQECLSEYKMLEFDFRELINDVIANKKYDTIMRNKYKETHKRVRELISKDSESKPKKKLIRKFVEEVNKELESFNFYVPEADNG